MLPLSQNGVEVEESLRGVFPAPVPRVDERLREDLRVLFRATRPRVSKNKAVGVTLQTLHRVALRLPLCEGGVGFRDCDARPAETLHRGREGGLGARRGLQEDEREDLALHLVLVLLRIRSDVVRERVEALQLIARDTDRRNEGFAREEGAGGGG